MREKSYKIVAYFFAFFLALDHRVCSFWMKATGLGRKSFVLVPLIVCMICRVLYTILLGSSFFLVPIDVCILAIATILYLRWLRDPSMGLSTVKIHNIYYNMRVMGIFYNIMIMYAVLFVFIVFIFATAPIYIFSSVFFDIFIGFIVTMFSQSGPPQPDATYWQKAKSKVRSMIENRPRSFAPTPA